MQMKTLRNILMILGAVITIIGITLFLIGYLKPRPAGIFVDTSPASDVYINNVFEENPERKIFGTFKR